MNGQLVVLVTVPCLTMPYKSDQRDRSINIIFFLHCNAICIELYFGQIIKMLTYGFLKRKYT